MFSDINEVKSILEIEAMSLEEAQNYILKVKAQFSTLSLIKYWKTNSKYIYGKIYKKYNIPTTGNMIKVNKQNKWQEQNEMKLKEMIDKSEININDSSEKPFKYAADSKIEVESKSNSPKLDIMQYLNMHFKSEKIVNFSSEKDGIIIVLNSGSKIKIAPLSNSKIKLDIEFSAVYTI